MLDKKTFLREIAILAELFNRPALSEVLVGRYYDYLDQHLTTEQFEQAARQIFAEDQYWPAPIRFLHAAKGDPQQLARQEWDALIAEATAGKLADLTDQGKTALRAIGGWSTVAYANQAALPSLRRAFLESYSSTQSEPEPALQLDSP